MKYPFSVAISGICFAVAVSAPALAQQSSSGLDLKHADKTVSMKDDVYGHVNGSWDKNTQIPADKSRWGSFDELRETALANVRSLIDASVKNPGAPGSEAHKIAALYQSFMDEKARNAAGFSPLKAELAKIAAIKDKKDIPALIAGFNRTGVSAPFGGFVGQDSKNSTAYAVYVSQSGLGLPDRDYYLKDDDAKLTAVRAQYLKHIEAMFVMSGDPSAAAHAAQVLAVETSLATAQWSRVENRNADKTYNRIELNKLASLTPSFDWTPYLAATGLTGKADFLIVRQPGYLSGFAATIASQSLDAWKQYFNWKVLEAYGEYLNTAAVNERFAFSGTVVRGVPENEAQWQLAVRLTNGVLGEAVGKLYVEKFFPPENKARMLVLINNLLAAFRESIDTLDWMSPATKKEAQTKLASFKPYIAYPDKWRDYSSLQIKQDDLVGNLQRASEFSFQRGLNKLGQPIDRDEWNMTPQTVNASYSPVRNAITFPAAILQPPFFDAKADDAVNYGGIGAVIGHEISHGFDDQGSKYDANGNLRDWWTKEDRANFTAKAAGLIKQYGALSPLPGYNVNGELTLGENIGDNSGLAIAYKAYQKSLGGKAAPVMDGYTGEQRFFMGWAQVWRNKSRDAAMLVQLKTDPHTPAALRANGAVVNQPGFYRAFDVKPGDKLYLPPEQRVIMW